MFGRRDSEGADGIALFVYHPQGDRPPHRLRILRLTALANGLSACFEESQRLLFESSTSYTSLDLGRPDGALSAREQAGELDACIDVKGSGVASAICDRIAASLSICLPTGCAPAENGEVPWDPLPSALQLKAQVVTTSSNIQPWCHALLAAASGVTHNLEVMFHVEACDVSCSEPLQVDFDSAAFAEVHERAIGRLTRAKLPLPPANGTQGTCVDQVQAVAAEEQPASADTGARSSERLSVWPEGRLRLSSAPRRPEHDMFKPAVLMAMVRAEAAASHLAAACAVAHHNTEESSSSKEQAQQEAACKEGRVSRKDAAAVATADVLADWKALISFGHGENGAMQVGREAPAGRTLWDALEELSSAFASRYAFLNAAQESQGALPQPAEHDLAQWRAALKMLFVYASFGLGMYNRGEGPALLRKNCQDDYRLRFDSQRLTALDLRSVGEEAHLQSLEISQVSFDRTPVDGKAAAHFCRQLQWVESLALEGSLVCGARLLGEVLSGDKKLRRLQISSARLSPTDCAALAGLARTTPLQHLNLSCSQVGDEGAREIARQLRGTQLRQLLLRDCSIGSVGGVALAMAAAAMNGLDIDLAHNDIGSTAMEILESRSAAWFRQQSMESPLLRRMSSSMRDREQPKALPKLRRSSSRKKLKGGTNVASLARHLSAEALPEVTEGSESRTRESASKERSDRAASKAIAEVQTLGSRS